MAEAADRLNILSERERQIAGLYANGDTYKEIAQLLNRSPSTVRNHLAAIFQKLEINNKVELLQVLLDGSPDRDPVEGGREILPGREATRILQPPNRPSIAVLPFTNMSGDSEQTFFSDGVTEDIITELSRFSGLFVIARNSSFSYKDQSVDVVRVAADLGVRYVLEGSVRRSGQRLRITAQLIDGATGGHVWAEKYDCDSEDVFELQDEITRKVVGAIAPQVELAELARSRTLTDVNLTAYELALKAQALAYDAARTASPDVLATAQATVDAALALDQRNVHALWTKSLACLYRHMYRWSSDPDADLITAAESADALIQIDSLDAKAYLIRAWVHLYNCEFDTAVADHHVAMSLNPNLTSNLFAMAWSEAVSGLVAEAREHTHLALRLSPRETDIWLGEGYAALAMASFVESEFAEAIKWGHLAHQRQPVLKALMVSANAYLGDLASAANHAQVLTEFAPGFVSAAVSGNSRICKLPEHNQLLVTGLRRAGL